MSRQDSSVTRAFRPASRWQWWSAGPRGGAKILSTYGDGFMLRTDSDKKIEDFKKYLSIPIINGLSPSSHPTQVLSDVFTVEEIKKKPISKLNICGSAGKDVRPAVTLVDDSGNELCLAGTNVPAHYFLPASAMVNLELQRA